MKVFCLLLFPVVSLAQSEACKNASILYSRELFSGSVTGSRAVALAEFDNDCKDEIPPQPSMVKVRTTGRDTYQYFPIDSRRQVLIDHLQSFDVDTEQLVNHLVFDRK